MPVHLARLDRCSGGDYLTSSAGVGARQPARRRLLWAHGRRPFQGGTVKITDVTLTLFGWDDIPSTTYGRHTGKFGGKSQLGLLAIQTDEGLVGHAFLGSAMRGAHLDGQSLITVLKPVVMGQDPLERERLYQSLMARSRQTTLRAIGAVDVALWDLAGKAAGMPLHRLLGSYRDRVPAYASSARSEE